ncbi:MAG: hypothetical protein KDE56_02745 [Anaerolineales bacterium]|nr:hypothetical protein [Anaerolineales bacterium]
MDKKLTALQELNFGRVVAEQDDLLKSCFIPHVALTETVNERVDIVLGAKGSGKSAIWVELFQNQDRYPQLSKVIISPATNPKGDPEFRDVLAAIDQQVYPSEDDLRLAWRLYILGQVWKVIQDNFGNQRKYKRYLDPIAQEIKKYGLVDRPSNLKRAFAFALAKARALKKASINWKEGVQFEFDNSLLVTGHSYVVIPFNEIFESIDKFLAQTNQRIWIILDRLDEIIIGSESSEAIVLKGLLLGYRDVSDLKSVKIKIFLRDDVYERVTQLGQFPALTHIRSKATQPIRWSLEDLMHLVVRRLVENKPIRPLIRFRELSGPAEYRNVFYTIFPDRIDKGRAAEGFKWIVDRIKDGNDVATPRDLLSVLERARTTQLEKVEKKEPLPPGEQIFDADTIRKAVKLVAEENLTTRIYAEYPDLKQPILRFSGGKADHSIETLQDTLKEFYNSEMLQRLKSVGFLYQRERKGYKVWTIPFFYSFALDVKRGFAFDIDDSGEEEDEDFV